MKHKSVEHLLDAIQQGQLSKIISLIKYGHNIYVKNKVQQNLLVYIIQQQRHQQDSSLIQKRFQIFKYLIKHYNLDIHSLDSYGKNLFNWTTNLNCTQEALYLLNTYPGDIDILRRDRSGSCSLHYAVEHGNEVLVHAIVNYLLRYRMRFDIKDAYDNTPEDLANKLGYEKISHFLNQACRSTIFMSREIPFKLVETTKTPSSTSSSSSSSSSIAILSEYYFTMETRIHAAKSVEDWETVRKLRAFRKSMKIKKSNKTLDPQPQTHTKTSSIPCLPKIVSSENTSSSNDISGGGGGGSGQSEQMLHLFELHLSSSFRRPFVPICQRTIVPTVIFQRSQHGHHKIGHSSPAHISSALNLRRTDLEPSQISPTGIQENHLSIPPVYRQHRQTAPTTN
ncbi:hypothetical protein I4U23_001127 [Adineta vaga]|nr:hypothetical protein I4U23_001127 [Adineta vaga]